ncbi:hypothetical protein H6P81_020825 [Aristolochia fimbriata]|uniref:Uncharacterized protein n=1 Tax=Aristolochia fimbriata TaxID=158543 RepID=A0AAV7DVI5_ARIFI|nr:hypothetical protein H6P81_020825 [Aristolochia fimbriata]
MGELSAGRMDFQCSDVRIWKDAISAYQTRLESRGKPDLVRLDDFYRNHLPILLHARDPKAYMTKAELKELMQWKLSRGKWRPRLMDFVSKLDEVEVETASQKAFEFLPDISKAISELTILKGVGPATASAVLAAYAPDIAPFMSDEAMVAALGNSKDYTLKQYLILVEKLQNKAKELSIEGDVLTPTDIERALWSSSVGSKLVASQPDQNAKANSKRKRKDSEKSTIDSMFCNEAHATVVTRERYTGLLARSPDVLSWLVLSGAHNRKSPLLHAFFEKVVRLVSPVSISPNFPKRERKR